jgi:PadR family transcriptional regulator PadR
MNFLTTSSLLDACVLAVVNTGDIYGYALTQRVADLLEVSESTLYPVLRRLQKENYLEIYDQQINGRNRRYYKITKVGQGLLKCYQQQWQDCKKSLDKILKGKLKNV